MTEEKLDPAERKASKGRIVGLFLALFAILALGVWLFRQPIAEAVARSVCDSQKLACNLSITRLDFGGLALTDVDVRAPGAANAAVEAQSITIDLAWDGPLSPRPVAVIGDSLTVRLDLTGRRSVYGDLEQAITNFTRPTDQPSAPMPRIELDDLILIGDTISGPVFAKGRVKASDANSFTVELAAQPASFGVSGASVELSAGRLDATVAGNEISAALALDLSRFSAEGASIADVKLNATLQQSAGVLKGQGAAQLGEVKFVEASVNAAEARAEVEVSVADNEASSLGDWLANVRRLSLNASAGAGDVSGASWTSATLTALIAPGGDGRSAGDVRFVAEDLHMPQLAAGQIALDGKVEIASGRAGTASGVLAISAGLTPAQQREALADGLAGPLEAALPVYADALRRAIDRAGQAFDATLPWSARADAEGIAAALLSGAEFKSRSGLAISAVSESADTPVATYFVTPAGSWRAGGRVTIGGGGGPPLTLGMESAAGSEDKLAMTGAMTLRPWQVGADVLSGALSDVIFKSDGADGSVSGALALRLDGALAGAVWKGAGFKGDVSASWDRDSFVADAPRGGVIDWDAAAFGDTTFGAAALRYTPDGHLAQRADEGLGGRGVLAPVRIPVSGESYEADAELGAIAIDWRTAPGFHAAFDMAPAKVGLTLDEREVPIAIQDLSGTLELAQGWKVAGAFSGASVETSEGHAKDISGKFDLAGAGEELTGSLSGISLGLIDPLEQGRRYEDLKFRGEGFLRSSVADFTGTFTLAKSGLQVAHVSGRHSLENNEGFLTFDPTPLIFRPGQFQPSEISPMLIGPANVTGRVDVSGKATWSADHFDASGVLDLRKLGFALAAAGVFEGVSGKVEIADLLAMKSAPGQRITLDKVTLGLPIEHGDIAFQLIGYDAIKVESAQWPFGGGSIRVDPTTFAFASGSENRVVARAVNWDLALLAEQFKLPDMKLSGVVGGEFPVVFTTGSAEIDNAVLKSVKPGVIQYSGSSGDAAAQADANSKMLFDALKDFHYEVLEVGLDGNLTGQMLLKVGVLGRNPDVLGGQPFQLNIGIDSALVPLLTSTLQQPDPRVAIDRVTEQTQ